MSIDKKLLRLYAITDRSCLHGVPLTYAVEKALRGGATMLQLREKNTSFDDFVKAAREIKKICEKYNVPLIINDNVRVAIDANADGVHLGQNDMNPADARKILGSKKIIGVTAKTVTQALKAQQDGADYLGSGAVFGTSTKSDAVPLPLDTLRNITAAVNIPVAAIGGINSENILRLAGCGAAGAAVVSGIFAAEDIESAARGLYEKAGKII